MRSLIISSRQHDYGVTNQIKVNGPLNLTQLIVYYTTGEYYLKQCLLKNYRIL